MKRLSQDYSYEGLEQVATRFKLLAEPMRLRLLQLLCNGEMTVNALSEAAACSQANTSKHLAQLLQGGVVARRKEGLKVYYRITDDSIFSLCEIVCRRLEDRAAEQQSIFKSQA